MRPIDRLLDLMATLRHPERGCSWDLQQTFSSIAPHTIEEAYEVADAIQQNDLVALKDELGDLLFQVVFHAQMAQDQGAFDFDAVVEAIITKMIRRHPHIFADAPPRSPEAQTAAWEDGKAAERVTKGCASTLDGVARTLPPMTRAIKLQNRAAGVGFDWNGPEEVFAKINEELDELRYEVSILASQDRIEDEFGDVLFACVNLARKLKINPEQALGRANGKFERRFRHVEARLADLGRHPRDASLEEMEEFWVDAKRLEGKA